MAFCTLIHSYSRNQLHSLLCRDFGKRSASIWRNFVRSSDFETRGSLSGSCVSFSKAFSTWNKTNFSCLCLGPLKRGFNIKKSSLHYSRSLLQGDAVYLSEQLNGGDSEKDVKTDQVETENISSINEEVKKHYCETFGGKNEVERVAENPVNNESLIDCSTVAEHVTLLKDAKHSVEKKSPGTQECESSSIRNTVLLTPGLYMWIK